MNLKRILGIAFGLCFIYFAAVQYNDPDPLVWIPIYLIASALSFAAAFNKVNTTVLAIACVLYAAGVIYCWPEQYEGVGDSMRDATTGKLLRNVEEGRESLGLLTCSVAMLSFILISKFSKKKTSSVRTAVKA